MSSQGYGRLSGQDNGAGSSSSGFPGNGSAPVHPRDASRHSRLRWTIIGVAAVIVILLFTLLGTASRGRDGRLLHSAASRLGSYAGVGPSRWSEGGADRKGIAYDDLSVKDPWIKTSGRKGLKYTTPFNADDLTMTDDECDAAFPALYKEIDRSVEYFSKQQKFDKEYLEYSCDDGVWTHARVVIYENRVYLKSFQDSEPTRTKAALSLLHMAVTASRQKLPNVEFCIGLMDWGSRGKFGLDRAAEVEDVWLMPDYGFWSWPEHVGSYADLRERTEKIEEEIGWSGKKSSLLWRGSLQAGTADREALVGTAANHRWSDVSAIDWTSPDKRPIAMEDHCKWKYLAYPEGNSNNGRLRYLQNCHSVIVTRKPRWIQHWTHLYNADWNSKDQNVVFVPHTSSRFGGSNKGVIVHDSEGREAGLDRSWEKLPQTMDKLLRNDRLSRKIADNQWNFFRQRYITPASAMCYWRKAINGFAKVQRYEVDLSGKETSLESFMLLGMRGWHH